MPHRRDTLGIFQFPWGEKSDSAVYDPIPVPNRATMQAFALFPDIEAKQRQMDPEPAEYSSSFFDDYEEDCDLESDENSEDDFDESTLWEIANLLDPNSVFSKKSPPPRIIEDYEDEDDDESVTLETAISSSQLFQAQTYQKRVDFVATTLESISAVQALQSRNFESSSATPAGFEPSGTSVWRAYTPALSDAVRAKPSEASSQVPRIANGDVRSPLVEKADTQWTQRGNGTTEAPLSAIEHSSGKSTSHESLWTAPQTNMDVEVAGLFDASINRTDYRISNEVPAATVKMRKLRINITPLPVLESQGLWRPSSDSPPEHHWVSESFVQAPSPFVYSASPTGQSSRTSGRSSPSSGKASIKSSSTKASSVHNSDETNVVDLNAPTNGVLQVNNVGAATDNYCSRQPSKRPISTGGSKVMASSDIWESRIQTTEGTLIRKSWRSSKINAVEICPEKERKKRNVATPAEWDAALMEAISLGSSAADKVVAKTTSTFTGTQKYSQLWTPLLPAASQPASDLLWTKPSSVNENSSSPWAPQVEDNIRRRAAKTVTSVVLPTLSSTSFWHPTTPTESMTQNWLHASSQTSGAQSCLPILSANSFIKECPTSAQSALETASSMAMECSNVDEKTPQPNLNIDSCNTTIGGGSLWMPPPRTNADLCNMTHERCTLWTPIARKVQRSQEMCPTAPQTLTKRRPYSSQSSLRQSKVEKVNCTGLWRPLWALQEKPKDWLISRSSSKVQFRY